MGALFSTAVRRNCKYFSFSYGSEWETGGIIIHMCTLKNILFCFSYNCRHKSNKYIIFKFKIIIYITTEHIANQPPGMLLRVRQLLYKCAGMYPGNSNQCSLELQTHPCPLLNQQHCFLACKNSNLSRSQKMSLFLATVTIELQTPTCSVS